MWRHVLIFLPLVVATLELGSHMVGSWQRLMTTSVIIMGFFAILRKPHHSNWKKMARPALLSLGGTIPTFILANQFNFGPLVASGLVGLVGARFLSEQDQLPFYLGVFVGMSSSLRFSTLTPLIGAGILGGILWELLDDAWVGVGGRLGTLAATAVLIVLLMSGGGS